MSLSILRMMGLNQQTLPQLNIQKFTKFIGKIYQGYRRKVQYHNDIHGADVGQMMFTILAQGNMIALAKLNNLDLLSILTSSVCHDFGHDGLNNAYHVNAMSERALRYNDQAVQENYHTAESFRILKQK